MVHFETERTGFFKIIYLMVAEKVLDLGPSYVLMDGLSIRHLLHEGVLGPQVELFFPSSEFPGYFFPIP